MNNILLITSFIILSIMIFGCKKNNELGINQVIKKQETQNALILFGGQSNASSANSANLLPLHLRQPLAGIFIWNQITQNFQPYQAGVNSYTLAYNNTISTAYGSELYLAIKYRSRTGKNVYIVKHAVGGTPFYERPEYDYNPNSQNEGLSNIIEQTNNAQYWLQNAGINYSFQNIVWIHGEQDGKFQSSASNYSANLSSFKNIVQNNTNSTLKLIYTRVATPRAYLNIIRQQMQDYQVNNPTDKMINIDDMPLLRPVPNTEPIIYDNTHYYFNEINTIGARISNHLL